MLKIVAAALLLLSTTLSKGAVLDEGSYAGIWQDVNLADHYYVIQEKEGRVLVIALPGVAQSGDTLRFSYIGNVDGDADSVEVSRLSTDSSAADIYGRLKLEFISPEEGVVYPICDLCSTAEVRYLQRVF
jgi:hypothetical protein